MGILDGTQVACLSEWGVERGVRERARARGEGKKDGRCLDARHACMYVCSARGRSISFAVGSHIDGHISTRLDPNEAQHQYQTDR
jgi:hypothetical protein